MASTRVEAIVHPVRLRILLDIAGRERTPYEIHRSLPDVSLASLYRHLKRLCDAGVLTVVRETPVRGAVEKVYAMADTDAADLGRAEFSRLSREDHLRAFTDFVSALLGQFRLYLHQEKFDVLADGVSYRMIPVSLSAEEREAFQASLRTLLQQATANPPTPERRRQLVTVIQMPAGEIKETKR